MLRITMHTAICIWLTLLYIICTTLVIFSLSTYQLQHRIFDTLKNPPKGGATLGLYDCEAVDNSKPKINANGLKQTRCIPLSANSKVSTFTPGSLKKQLDVISYYEGERDNFQKQLKKLQDTATPSSNEHNKIKKKKISDLEEQISNVKVTLGMLNTQIEHLAGVLTDINYLDSITKFLLFGQDQLWLIPEDILIVFLIFSMGTLGSLIFLTMEFLKQDDGVVEKFSMYFFRPLLGMVMALAVFVMFKSGQYALGIESEEHLSPFFISFISIISGMMSEKAYGSLTLQGEKILLNGNNGN